MQLSHEPYKYPMEIPLRGRGFHLKGVIWQQDIQRLFLDKPISIETITGTFKNRMKVCFQFSFVELLRPSDEWLLTHTQSVSERYGERFFYISLSELQASQLVTQISI